MAAATFVEHASGHRLYGEWWFSALWALLTGVSIVWFLQQRVRKPMAVALHLSFVIILLGAFLTHLTSRQGVVHLRWGEQTHRYVTEDGILHELPFTVRLDSFKVVLHEGTMAAADYESHLTLIDTDGEQSVIVSMNRICSHRDIRLYQSSYDADGHGTVLAMNSDPWGIPVTYAGYALLFVSLVWMLVDPRGKYRQLLRSPLLSSGRSPQLRKGMIAVLLLCCVCSSAIAAPRTLPKEKADQFGQLLILYNDRVCPVETYALDFTKKLYGKRHYGDYTACQVLTGFIFFGDEWSREPIVRIKGGELKEARQLPDYTSVNTFFHPQVGYVLGSYVQEYYQGGQHDAFHKQAAAIDDQLMMVMDLRQGMPLKMFPYAGHNSVTWYSPTAQIDAEAMPADNLLYIRESFALLNEAVQAGNMDQVAGYLKAMHRYQQKQGGTTLPSETVMKAERLYNAVPFATILFMFNLTMGFLTLVLYFYFLGIGVSRSAQPHLSLSSLHFLLSTLLFLSFLALTVCGVLRWVVSGNIPMSNGYETMLLLAWLVQLTSLLLSRRIPILLSFGFLLSGFFLLVSHISQMNPQIGRLMPVLNSPLLTIHVGIIMMAFALLSLTFLSSLIGLLSFHSPLSSLHSSLFTFLSRLFLYPALTTLGLGIFIGAIWANVSWGSYWSWDPKETWALITFMVYAVAVHEGSLPAFRRPLFFHAYMVLAFLTILMTYFGVNYFLGGMHSYA